MPPDAPTSSPTSAPQDAESSRSTSHFSLLRWAPWVLTAGFAALGLALTQLYFGTRAELARLRDELTLTEMEARTFRHQVEAGAILSAREQELARAAQTSAAARLAERDVRIAQLESQTIAQPDLSRLKIVALQSQLDHAPRAHAIVVWDSNRREGVLHASRLPAISDDRDYQLWLIDAGEPKPVEGGVFHVSAESGNAQVIFRTAQTFSADAVRFIVSRERRGGATTREGPVVLASE